MQTSTSKKAVTDYLDAMFFDVAPKIADIEEIANELPIKPADSIEQSCRMVHCTDPFQMMALNEHPQDMKSTKVLASRILLNLSLLMPTSALKNYCLRQYQTLAGQIDRAT